MSHIVKANVEMKNERCLVKAAEYLGLENLGKKTHKLYAGQTAEGIGFTLPGWSYPVVVNPENGVAKFDNYNGAWGKQIELDKLVQRYSIEAITEQAELEGYNIEENELENGDVEMVMTSLSM